MFERIAQSLPHLIALSLPPDPGYRLPCVALSHNEARLLPEFLSHYRKLGVDRFFIVDDRSTDGSTDLLKRQPDVTLFVPVEGSTYARDKRFWRAELLDAFATGRWVVVPDIDEHLVFRDCETRGLGSLIAQLEAEGAEALHAVMLDMYRDAPLADQVHDRPTLIESFPLFDGPDHYFRIAAPGRFRKKYPTPHCMVIGGMRQRMFEPIAIDALGRMRTSCDIAGPMAGGLAFRLSANLVRLRLRLRRVLRGTLLYNCSKVPLVHWRQGMFYYNGAHALSKSLKLSHHRSVLLHFKFAGGVESSRYAAARGQHTGGAQYYRRMVAQIDDAPSPRFDGSQHYDCSASLSRLLS